MLHWCRFLLSSPLALSHDWFWHWTCINWVLFPEECLMSSLTALVHGKEKQELEKEQVLEAFVTNFEHFPVCSLVRTRVQGLFNFGDHQPYTTIRQGFRSQRGLFKGLVYELAELKRTTYTTPGLHWQCSSWLWWWSWCTGWGVRSTLVTHIYISREKSCRCSQSATMMEALFAHCMRRLCSYHTWALHHFGRKATMRWRMCRVDLVCNLFWRFSAFFFSSCCFGLWG